MARHYPISDWVDFSRDLDHRADHAAMQQHLDQGCERCAASVAALRLVAASAAADLALEVPPGVVRSAKAPAAPSSFGQIRPRSSESVRSSG